MMMMMILSSLNIFLGVICRNFFFLYGGIRVNKEEHIKTTKDLEKKLKRLRELFKKKKTINANLVMMVMNS